jgi:hypothetical protein
MANTLKFGNGEWYGKKDTILAYNDENSNYKPLPFDFDRGSTATRVNRDGLIETVGTDEPRVDYLNNSKGALLLEPSRTNLVTQSNNTTTSTWSHYDYGGGLMVDTYGYPSPNGKNEASRLVYTNSSLGSGGALLTTNITYPSASGVYTMSLWAKSVSGTKEIRFSPKNTSSAGLAGSRVTLTNEWKRYTFTFTNDGGTSRGFQFRITDSEDSGNRTFDVWGMTIEEGSYATSTIPTQGSAVTRSRDLSDTQNLSHVIGQTEGVIFYDAILVHKSTSTSEDLFELSIDDGSANNAFFINNYNNTLAVILKSGGSTSFSNNSFNPTEGARYKLGFAYKQNDFALYINGNQIATDSSGTVPSMNQITFGNYYDNRVNFQSNIKVNDFKLYNTRLSNTELATLTQV